jgi:hypothetical protein
MRWASLDERKLAYGSSPRQEDDWPLVEYKYK